MGKVKELSSLIHKKYDSEAALARALGWKRQRLNKISNGVKEPDLYEASALAEKLDVSLETMANIFLDQKSPNGQLTRGRTA